MPREAESLPEASKRIVATLARRENHWRVYVDFARRAGGRGGSRRLLAARALGRRNRDSTSRGSAARSRPCLPRGRGLVENAHLDGEGETLYARVIEARRQGLEELLELEAEKHDDVRADARPPRTIARQRDPGETAPS